MLFFQCWNILVVFKNQIVDSKYRASIRYLLAVANIHRHLGKKCTTELQFPLFPSLVFLLHRKIFQCAFGTIEYAQLA